MLRKSLLPAGLMALSVILTGCVSRSAFRQLEERVTGLQADQAAVAKQLHETEGEVASLNQQAGATASRVAAIEEQLSALKREVTLMDAEFKKTAGSITEVRSTFLKNLRGAREAHKRQYHALDELIREFNGQPLPE